MSQITEVSELKILNDALQKAKKAPPGKAQLRRDAQMKLIDASHSPHASVKVVAASNIHLYFIEFSDLEEDVINAVYDLCEDPSQLVRLAGYKAITALSNRQKKLVRRNADVLVQLLQSDEPEELVIVKKQLLSHLDLEAPITLQVLRDQISAADDAQDEEDRTARDGLRSLVLSFLTVEARRSIVERHTKPDSPAEKILIEGLLEAIPRSSTQEISTFTRNLLFPLSAIQSATDRAQALMSALATSCRSKLERNAHSADMAISDDVSTLLELQSVLCTKEVASPYILWKQYSDILMTDAFLGRLDLATEVRTAEQYAFVVKACNDSTLPSSITPSKAELLSVQHETTKLTQSILDILIKGGMSTQMSWTCCLTILDNLCRSKPALDSQLERSLRAMQGLAAQSKEEDASKVGELLKSLLPAKASPPLPTGPSAESSRAREPPLNERKLHRGRISGPPDVPRSVSAPRPLPTGPRGLMPPGQRNGSSGAVKRSEPPEQIAPLPKRPKVETQRSSAPSLLSRLNVSGRSASDDPPRTAAIRGAASRSPSLPETQDLSIRGAAQRENKDDRPLEMRLKAPRLAPSTLLDRMQVEGSRDDSGGGGSGGRKWRRGKT